MAVTLLTRFIFSQKETVANSSPVNQFEQNRQAIRNKKHFDQYNRSFRYTDQRRRQQIDQGRQKNSGADSPRTAKIPQPTMPPTPIVTAPDSLTFLLDRFTRYACCDPRGSCDLLVYVFRLFQHLFLQHRFIADNIFPHLLIRNRHDLRRQDAGIFGAVQRHRGHRHSAGHLQDRQHGIPAIDGVG